MVLAIPGYMAAEFPALFDQVYQLRHRVFVDRLGWRALARPDGRETDQFDVVTAMHLVGIERARVVSYSRLLPTSGPHLLRDVYPELVRGARVPDGEGVYEWTRLCTDPDRDDASAPISRPARELFVAMAEFCVAHGIHTIIAESDPLWITRLGQLGWHVRPLALPSMLEGKPVVPLAASADAMTVAKSRRILAVEREVLDTSIYDGRGPFHQPGFGQADRRLALN